MYDAIVNGNADGVGPHLDGDQIFVAVCEA